MVQVKKPMLENPIYCEILIKLGDKKVYVSEFINEWGCVEYGDEECAKDRSVLARQMEELAAPKNKYLLVDPKSKKYNKKIYYINREKITAEFVGYLIEFIDEKGNKEYAEKVAKKQTGYSLNPFIQDFVIYLVNSLDDGHTFKVNLKRFFMDIFAYAARVDTPEEPYSILMQHLGLGDILDKGRLIFLKQAKRLFKEENYTEFLEFEDFLYDMSIINLVTDHYYTEKLTHTSQNIAEKYLGEDEQKRITNAILHNLFIEDKKQYKPFYPKEEEDRAKIKRVEVKKIVKRLRELREKNYKEKDINATLRKLLHELKTKFYFLDVNPSRINVEDLSNYTSSLSGSNDNQVLIAEMVIYESVLSKNWGIPISQEALKDIEVVYFSNRLYISKEDYIRKHLDKP